MKTFKVGDRVYAGVTPEHYDEGYVMEVNGDQVTVAWDSAKQRTTQSADHLHLDTGDHDALWPDADTSD